MYTSKNQNMGNHTSNLREKLTDYLYNINKQKIKIIASIAFVVILIIMITKFFVVTTKVNQDPNTTSNIISTNPTTTPKLPSPTPSSIILLAGGWSDRDISTVEIISDEKSNNKTQLPNLPTFVPGPCMLKHNNVILICGLKSCQQMNVSSGSWTHHSSLTSKRDQASGVSTDKASYIFGDMSSTKGKKTYEILPKGSLQWQAGLTKIPNGYVRGCAVAISNDEIWLIGGTDTRGRIRSRILSFNTSSQSFSELGTTLHQNRYGHACVIIPGTHQILVTGGYTKFRNGYSYKKGILNSTEIIDIATGNVTYATPMNMKRYEHGIGIMTIDNEEKVVTFGGEYGNGQFLDSIEVYHTNTGSWGLLNKTLTEPKNHFGYPTIPYQTVFDSVSTNHSLKPILIT